MSDFCVFPDTNVFLHFPPLKDIDWCALADTKSVQLIICMTVIHELDAKKSDSRLSDRASRALREIRESQTTQSEIRKGVTVTIFNREIRSADFPDTLSPESADDRIIHLVKLYQAEHSDSSVCIATADYGMELRAQVARISTLQLAPELRLDNPQDELRKKNVQLTKELNQFRNRQPKLALALSVLDGSAQSPHEIIFEIDTKYEPVDIDASLKDIQQKYPKIRRPKFASDDLVGKMYNTHFSFLEGNWDRYNKDLDDYYRNYFDFLTHVNEVMNEESRSFWFDLWLLNEGTAVASDIDVSVRFPRNISFVAEKGTEDTLRFEKKLEPPPIPSKPQAFDPRPILDKLNRVPDYSSMIRPPIISPVSVIVERFTEDNIEIHAQVERLKHGNHILLGQFIAIFDSQEEIGSFSAEISLSTAEQIDVQEGELPFRVNRI